VNLHRWGIEKQRSRSRRRRRGNVAREADSRSQCCAAKDERQTAGQQARLELIQLLALYFKFCCAGLANKLSSNRCRQLTDRQ
jgi:hypothetical protein